MTTAVFFIKKHPILPLLVFFILIIAPQNIQSQSKTTELSLLDAAPDFELYPFPYDFRSTDIKDFFDLENNGKYPSFNLFDANFKTCWVTGSSKNDKHTALYLRIPANIDIEDLILNIFSGYGKSEQLYFKNSRPKTIKISIFSAFHPENFSTEVTSLYIIKKYPVEKDIELSDSIGIQSFPLNLNKEDLLDFQGTVSTECESFRGSNNYKEFLKAGRPDTFAASFILKLIITDTYPGTKYDDICISELFFNDRFITGYPDNYNEVEDVYIENDNTLVIDYTNGEIDTIIDSTSVFTMIDWPEKSDWAILHFVPDDEEGINSRMEEYYSLIDLKQCKIVDAEFEKCTGISPMFQIIETSDDGKSYINNDGKFNIELK